MARLQNVSSNSLGSWGEVVGISLLFLTLVLAVLFGVILLLPDDE
jgi:hypothetical protein